MIATTLRREPTKVLLGFVAVGFAFLILELLFIGHTQGSQIIAIIAAVVGIVASVLALLPGTGMRKLAIGLFIVLALSGLYGFNEHREERAERPEQASAALQAATSRVDREALESFLNNPPVLSPLALSGLAVLGIVTLMIAEPARSA